MRGGGTAVAASGPPASWDGLELRKVKGLDAVYVRPGVVFKEYRTLYLAPVEVAFDRNWDPNASSRGVSGRLSAADIEKIRADMATAGRSYTFTVNAGRMTLVMELRDGPTAQLLARVVDRYVGRDNGYMSISNGVANSAEFRRAVQGWADRLVKALDRVARPPDPAAR